MKSINHRVGFLTSCRRQCILENLSISYVLPFSVHKPVILLVKTCQIQFCFEYAAGLAVLSIHASLMTLTPPLCDVNYSHRSKVMITAPVSSSDEASGICVHLKDDKSN